MICTCGNTSRYIDQHGALTCGICPIRAGIDSIRIADVPSLLNWARTFVNVMEREPPGAAKIWAIERGYTELLDIIGRKPT